MKSFPLLPFLTLTALLAGSAAWAGPKATGSLRLVTPDGGSVIAQGALASSGALNQINVDASKAFLKSGGKCAFNLKYEEVSTEAAFQTTNRLYDNDQLIAQTTKIDVAPGVPKTIWIQSYFGAGTNNLRLVIDADGKAPATSWVRVNVNGTCGDTAKPPTAPPPAASGPMPPPTPAPVKYAPGSAQWNALYNAWGYSNYGVTQLKAKGYVRYADLVKVNADLAVAVKAGSVEAGAWTALMARWNAIATDADFLALMAKVVPGTPGVH